MIILIRVRPASLVRVMVCLLLLLAVSLAGCTPVSQYVKRPLGGEGELFLYLEQFPAEALRLEYRVAGVTAIREDGLAVPLTVELASCTPHELPRQRLFARGIVPAGRYTAVSVHIKEASLDTEDGRMRLLVPERSFENRADFSVKSNRALVATLNLDYRASVGAGMRFTPVYTISIPPLPLTGLTGYVTNRLDNTITVFDRRSARIGTMIETGRGPAGIVLDQQRFLGYVSLSGEDAVAVFDVRDNEFFDRIRLQRGDEPHFIAMTPNGLLAVTANKGSNTASILDLSSRVELARIPVGVSPEYVLMDRNGVRAYVFNRNSASITVIDLAGRSVAGTLATESGPVYGQFNRKGDQLYVFHETSQYLLAYNVSSFSISRRITTGGMTSALKVNPATDRIYAGTPYGGLISVYDPFSLMAMDHLRTEGGAGYLTIDGEENNLVVLTPRERMLRLVNLVSKQERGIVDTGMGPYTAVLSGER